MKKRKNSKSKTINVVVTIVLVILAVLSATWAGLTLYGVDVVDKVGNIFDDSIEATELDFVKNEITLGVGQTSDLNIIMTPENATSTYKFSSTDEKVVKTNKNKVEAVAKGSCTVKVRSDNNLSAYCEVTVVEAPEKLLIPHTLSVAVTENYSFTPDVGKSLPDNAIKYSSSDENILKVEQDGTIIPINKGNAVVTAETYNNVSATCKVEVCSEPSKFVVQNGEVNINIGDTIALQCEFEEGQGASSVSFKSKDKSVVKVDNEGNVTGIKEGSATIECTLCNGVKSECVVNVVDGSARIRKGLDRTKPMVALTFDDGPNGKSTKSILKTLSKYHGRATFFVVGQRISDEAEILKETYDAGHEVGSHSWDHKYATDLKKDEQMDEVRLTNEAIYNAIGAFPTMFRCPGGISCDTYEKKSNMPLIMWSIDTIDWSTKNSESTYKAITKIFKKGENLDGDIVLMHDIQNSTPKAVEKICKYLDKKGYQFVTVSELAYYKGYELKKGETYNNFYN